jgi:3-deoxy-D-manno-octulosonic-acid transferase
MRFLYSLVILFYTLFIQLSSLFNKKAKLWCTGRVNILKIIEKKCKEKENIVWFHCASLGEFEQGKPLMEKIRQEEKDVTLLVTFFSPSGFEIRKNDPKADIITYLPVDTPKNARKFIRIVKPKKVFFIKYEYWYNYIHELVQKNIPFYYVSAIFRENQYFFKNYGKWFLKHLKNCNHFFVQNDKSKFLLRENGISQVTFTGDTRFDRVYNIAQQPFNLDFIKIFQEGKKILVAGSTWTQDEKLLAELFNIVREKYKLVIAPHIVEIKHIKQIIRTFHPFSTVCYSEKEEKDFSNFDILIIDTIGLLSKIYKYADISYIGGGFKTGLHNILEAAVYEKPLFFGPHYQKFNEAVELVEQGGAFSIHNAKEMTNKIVGFENNPSMYQIVCKICKNYIAKNLGATDKIMSEL